jgi:small nuclear ribonucleoprotein (snRNP)-like protein
MRFSRFHRRIDARNVSLKLTDGSLVKGKINLFQDQKLALRLSDIFLKQPEPFVVVFDATLGEATGKVLVINKNNIVWATPED